MSDVVCAAICVIGGAVLGYLLGRYEDIRHERKCRCGRVER